MAYNLAALRGGSIQDAIDEIEGGWAIPGFSDNLATSYGDSAGDVDKVKAIMLSKFDFKDPNTLDRAVRLAYTYDSALMAGRPDVYRAISTQLKAEPAMKKLVSYVRRVAHRGDSKPEKVTRLMSLQRRAASEALRRQRQSTLKGMRWFGSAPYRGVKSTVEPYYKGLYVTGGRKGATPWYSGIGSRVTAESLFRQMEQDEAGEPAVKRERGI